MTKHSITGCRTVIAIGPSLAVTLPANYACLNKLVKSSPVLVTVSPDGKSLIISPESRIECPSCMTGKAFEIDMSEKYDTDEDGAIHHHNQTDYLCKCKQCGHVFVETETPTECWCGWKKEVVE